MVRYVANVIPVDIIAFIFIPVIVVEFIQHECAIGGNVECISGEIIMEDSVLITACLNAERPAISLECILAHLDPVGAFHQDGHGIPYKTVAHDLPVGDLFQLH